MRPKSMLSFFAPAPSFGISVGAKSRARIRLMRWLVIDSSCSTRHQRSPGILLPDALQPFLRRCSLLGHLGVIANRIIIDIGILLNRNRQGTGTSHDRSRWWGRWDPLD